MSIFLASWLAEVGVGTSADHHILSGQYNDVYTKNIEHRKESHLQDKSPWKRGSHVGTQQLQPGISISWSVLKVTVRRKRLSITSIHRTFCVHGTILNKLPYLCHPWKAHYHHGYWEHSLPHTDTDIHQGSPLCWSPQGSKCSSPQKLRKDVTPETVSSMVRKKLQHTEHPMKGQIWTQNIEEVDCTQPEAITTMWFGAVLYSWSDHAEGSNRE